MFIDNATLHSLISDYLNQNCDLSSTDILSFQQQDNKVDVKVSTGEIGKKPKEFIINIQFNDLQEF